MLRRLILYLLLSTLCVGTHAQSVYEVQTYDDATSNIQEIDRMAQDKAGFIWLSTCDGLYRFDGYRLRSFRPTEDEGVNIGSDDIDRMHADGNGNLWCVIDNRVYMFNTHSLVFHDVQKNIEEQHGRTFVVRNIRPVSGKEMILLCDDGIAVAVNAANAGKTSKVIIDEGSGNVDVNVKDGEAWLTTAKGRYIYSKGECKPTSREYVGVVPDNTFHTDRFGNKYRSNSISW